MMCSGQALLVDAVTQKIFVVMRMSDRRHRSGSSTRRRAMASPMMRSASPRGCSQTSALSNGFTPPSGRPAGSPWPAGCRPRRRASAAEGGPKPYERTETCRPVRPSMRWGIEGASDTETPVQRGAGRAGDRVSSYPGRARCQNGIGPAPGFRPSVEQAEVLEDAMHRPRRTWNCARRH